VKQNNETSGSDAQSSAALPLKIMQPAAPPLNISGIAAQCIISCLAAQTFVSGSAAQILYANDQHHRTSISIYVP